MQVDTPNGNLQLMDTLIATSLSNTVGNRHKESCWPRFKNNLIRYFQIINLLLLTPGMIRLGFLTRPPV